MDFDEKIVRYQALRTLLSRMKLQKDSDTEKESAIKNEMRQIEYQLPEQTLTKIKNKNRGSISSITKLGWFFHYLGCLKWYENGDLHECVLRKWHPVSYLIMLALVAFVPIYCMLNSETVKECKEDLSELWFGSKRFREFPEKAKWVSPSDYYTIKESNALNKLVREYLKDMER